MPDRYAVACECGWTASLNPPGGRAAALAFADELAGAHLRDSPECDEPWVEKTTTTREALPRTTRPVPA
jgi:hypothetical protein